MLKDEWFEKESQEIGDERELKEVFKIADKVLKKIPLDSNDIDFVNKSIKDCFDYMRNYAEQHQKDGYYFLDDAEAEKIICDYLNIKPLGKVDKEDMNFVNLSEFI